MIGKRLESYQITSLLGRGSMGAVYRAVHMETQKKVAIKVLLQELSSLDVVRERAVSTIETLKNISDPNLIVPFQWKIHEQRLCLIMELVEGKCLSLFLDELTTKTDLSQLLPLFIGALKTVAQVHDKGLVCGNLRPCNFLMCKTPKGLTLKLTDIGLFPLDSQGRLAQTKGEEILNYAVYIAPEILHRKGMPSKRSDIFSLGATLYHLVTGWPPRIGLGLESIRKSAKKSLESPGNLRPDLSKELELALLTATSSTPEVRYCDADGFLEAIRPLVEVSSNHDSNEDDIATLETASPHFFSGQKSIQEIAAKQLASFPDESAPSRKYKRTISARARTQPLIPEDKLKEAPGEIKKHRKRRHVSGPRITPSGDQNKADLAKVLALRKSFSSLDHIPKVDISNASGYDSTKQQDPSEKLSTETGDPSSQPSLDMKGASSQKESSDHSDKGPSKKQPPSENKPRGHTGIHMVIPLIVLVALVALGLGLTLWWASPKRKTPSQQKTNTKNDRRSHQSSLSQRLDASHPTRPRSQLDSSIASSLDGTVPDGANFSTRISSKDQKQTRNQRPPHTPPSGKVRLLSLRVAQKWKSPIKKAIYKKIWDFRRCYRKLLVKKPMAKGNVLLRLLFQSSGSVASSLVIRTTLNHPPTEHCLQRVGTKISAEGPMEVTNASVTLGFSPK